MLDIAGTGLCFNWKEHFGMDYHNVYYELFGQRIDWLIGIGTISYLLDKSGF